MRLHTAINYSNGVPSVDIPPQYGRVHTIYQHEIPHMPHRWKCRREQIGELRARGIRVDDDGTVHQAGGSWNRGNLSAFKGTIEGFVRDALPKDFAGPCMLNIESLPLDDPDAHPYLAELVRAIIDRGLGNQIGFYHAFRYRNGDFKATPIAPKGLASCNFVSLYVYTKLIVQGRPWTTAEDNWSHWYSERLPSVRAAADSGLPSFAMISIGSDVFGMVSSDHLRHVITQASAWGFKDLLVWGAMRDPKEPPYMSQVLRGVRDFCRETGLI
jgi:hypothetical protein